MSTRHWASTAAFVGLIVSLGGCTQSPDPAESASAAVVGGTPLIAAACPDLGSCTANDVVTTVIEAEEIDSDDCADGYLSVQWTFGFATTANQRYDLGVFISTDGTAINDSNSCVGAAPQVGQGDGNTSPDADPDFFQNLDPHAGSADTCGDLSTAQGPVELTVSATVACTDVTPTGELTVPSCRVWQQNANHRGVCTDLTSAGTGSKCDCTPIVLHVDPCSLIVCNDGLFCNGEETCDSSSGVAVCQAGSAPSCDDGVSCTVDACNEGAGMCTNTPNNAICDDGLYCSGQETCDAVQGCVAGTPVTCHDDGAACTTEICNEATDSCQSSDNGLCGTLAPAGSGCTCTCTP